jgi:hypothetical protein
VKRKHGREESLLLLPEPANIERLWNALFCLDSSFPQTCIWTESMALGGVNKIHRNMGEKNRSRCVQEPQNNIERTPYFFLTPASIEPAVFEPAPWLWAALSDIYVFTSGPCASDSVRCQSSFHPFSFRPPFQCPSPPRISQETVTPTTFSRSSLH